jgi:hypothetical protein
VTRRVGDDELARRGGEVAVGDVDRDPLLALGRQPVEQQRVVDLAVLGAGPARVGLQRGQLVLEDELGLPQQAADQRALAVVDAPAGDEAEQVRGAQK